LVKFFYSSINPADINMINGVYPILPKLPGVAGSEAVGGIVSVGSNVNSLKLNDTVIPVRPALGTWRDYGVFNEKEMLKLPPDADGVDLRDLACLSVNPCTSHRILNDFVLLKEGDVIIQNGANSMVGICIIQMAKTRGIKTINIIRKIRPDFEKLREKLIKLGATIVCGDDEIGKPEFKKKLLSSQIPSPKLAINCVGGITVTEMARLLEKGGMIVTYGGMSKQPVTIPTSLYIFNDIKTNGFWLSSWIKENPKERMEMYKEVIKMFKAGTLKLSYDTYGIEDFKLAIKRSKNTLERDRKVILDLRGKNESLTK